MALPQTPEQVEMMNHWMRRWMRVRPRTDDMVQMLVDLGIEPGPKMPPVFLEWVLQPQNWVYEMMEAHRESDPFSDRIIYFGTVDPTPRVPR